MPVIHVKTSIPLTREEKINLVEKLNEAFRKGSTLERVANNIEYTVEDNVFIDFRRDHDSPSAYIGIHPGYLTEEKDYKPIMEGFFKVLKEELNISPDRAYVILSQIDFWGYDGTRVV